MARQMVWNNQGFFEFLDDDELFEPHETVVGDSYNKEKSKNKKKKESSIPKPVLTNTSYNWKSRFVFNDELYLKAQSLNLDLKEKKCPYCNCYCYYVNKHILRVHKENPLVEEAYRPPKKKLKKCTKRLTITEFTDYLKNSSKKTIKKFLYLRWNATKPTKTFPEYISKNNNLLNGNFDSKSIEVRKLYNFYISNKNIVRSSKSKTSESREEVYNDKRTDNIYHYSIGESFESKIYGKSNSYLNKGDHNFREEGRFGSSVLSDDYDN